MELLVLENNSQEHTTIFYRYFFNNSKEIVGSPPPSLLDCISLNEAMDLQRIQGLSIPSCKKTKVNKTRSGLALLILNIIKYLVKTI